MADLTQQIDEARKAGHSDDDIVSYLGSARPDLAPKIQEAKTHGYSSADIVGHLAGAAPSARVEVDAGPKPEDRGFWSTVGDDIAAAPRRFMDWVSGHPVADTVQALHDLTVARRAHQQRALDAYQKGDHKGAFEQLMFSTPIIGPPAGAAVDEMREYQKTHPDSPAFGTAGFAHGVEATAPWLFPALPGAVNATRRILPTSVRATPVIESTLNPVEQSAVDFLRSRDVPLRVGTQTGNKFVKSAEAVTQHSPLGAEGAEEFTRGTEQGLRRVAGELADETHPAPVTPESAGKTIRTSLDRKIESIQQVEGEAYEKAWEGRNDPAYSEKVPVRIEQQPELGGDGKPTGRMVDRPVFQSVNMPVDVRQIKEALRPAWDEMQWMPASDRASSAGYQAVKNILEGDDFIPAWQAERGLSGLKTMARVETPSGVRNVSQGIGASIIPSLQEAVDAAVAKTGDGAVRSLQNGRALHASKMDVADLADKLRAEPVQAFGQAVWRGDTGIEFLRRIAKDAPESLPQIGRAYVDQLFDEATREGGFARARTILSRWQDLGPETKALLFRDANLRHSLDQFFKGAEMVGQTPNPSGTALVNQATSLNPLRWLAGYAGSKLLFTPRGAQILTEGLRVPLGGARGVLAENALKRLALELAGPTAAASQQSPQ